VSSVGWHPAGDRVGGGAGQVVEGRADVLNLLRAGIKNVIAMNGTKLPDSIKKLGEEKDITLFVDGDRGGKLIAQNVIDNARVKFVAVAPDGKEVEELQGKEILMYLRKKMPVDEFVSRMGSSGTKYGRKASSFSEEKFTEKEKSTEKLELTKQQRDSLKEIYDNNKLLEGHVYTPVENEALNSGGRHQLYSKEITGGNRNLGIIYFWAEKDKPQQKGELFIPLNMPRGKDIYIELSLEKRKDKVELRVTKFEFDG